MSERDLAVTLGRVRPRGEHQLAVAQALSVGLEHGIIEQISVSSCP